MKKRLLALLIYLPPLALSMILSAQIITWLYASIYGVPISEISDTNSILLAIPTILTCISLVVTMLNYFAFRIGILRFLEDEHAFSKHQDRCWKNTRLIALASLPIVLLGFIL